MYIVNVIPLTKIPLTFSQTFTYFSTQNLKKGGLVLAPVSRRKVPCIVQECLALEKIKMEVRKGAFKLKGISTVLCNSPVVSENQIELALWLHRYYLTPLGLSLKLFLPQSIIKRKKPFNVSRIAKKKEKTKKKDKKPLFSWEKDRERTYIKEIKKVFKNKKQVLFLVPDMPCLEKSLTFLKKHFPPSKISLIHSNIGVSKELKEWETIRGNENGIILGTRSAVFTPYSNLGLIIIDQYESSSFKSWHQYPRYDARTIAQKIAKERRVKIIMGSNLPSAESYYKIQKKEYRTNIITPPPSLLKINVVDMREEIKKQNFSIFSYDLGDLISKSQKKKKQIILFINRRGLATSILCRDCGHVLKCPDCDAPMVYHKQGKDKKPVLICHHCGKKLDPPTLCPICQSWRIKPVGSGTQKVVKELKKRIPKARVLRLDTDTAKTLKEQEGIMKDFYQKKADILITTQLVLKFLPKEDYENKYVVGAILIDRLINLPEYRSQERAFRILWNLKRIASYLLIQTYNPELALLKHIKKKDPKDFLQEELENRKDFKYPPFSQLIKASFSHKDKRTAKEKTKLLVEKLNTHFKDSDPAILILGPAPGFIPKVKKRYIYNIVIKIKNRPKGLAQKVKDVILQNISKDLNVDVGPESLL